MSFARHLGRRAQAVAVALLICCLALPATPAAAQSANVATPLLAAEQDPAPSDTSQQATAELIVSPVSPVLDAAADEYSFAVLLRNPSDAPIAGGTVELLLGTDRLTDRAALSKPFPQSAATIASREIGETQAKESQALTLTVRRADVSFPPTAAQGVYLVQARFTPEDASDSAGDSGDSGDSGDPQSGEGASDGAGASDTGPVDDSEGTDPGTGGGTVAGADESTTSAPNGVLTATTPIVWRGVGSARLQLTMIVPLVFSADVRTMPSKKQLESLTPQWEELLTAATSQQATLAIDPRVIAGIRALGTEAPEEARAFLAKLEASELHSFLLQFADADPAAQAALGVDTLLQPSSLEFVTKDGKFPAQVGPGDLGGNGQDGASTPATDDAQQSGDAAKGQLPADGASPERTGDTSAEQLAGVSATEASGGTTPDGTAGPADPSEPGGEEEPPSDGSVPTLADLLAWPQATQQLAWPAEGEANEQTVSLLRDSGITSLVLSSDNVSLSGGARATLGSGTAIITDSDLGEYSRTALDADTPTERGHGTAQLTASLALAAQDGQHGLVLGFDRGAIGEAASPASLLTSIGKLPWVDTVEMQTQPSGSATLTAGETGERRAELLLSAYVREPSIDDIGKVLVHPEYLSGYQRTRLLDLLSTRYASPEFDFDAAAAKYQARDAELLDGVQAINTGSTQIVGVKTQIPVQLHNSLPFDAVVNVEAVPASAALSVDTSRFDAVAVPAVGNARLLIPVQSRVSSGESGLVITVTAESGDLTVYAGTLSVLISSVVEAIALWSLGVIAALLLGFGVWRSVRRSRRGISRT